MTHLRLWRFAVSPEAEQRFVEAYKSDGSWAQLFGRASGFIRTELWREGEGVYLTADHWLSVGDFEHFQAEWGDAYRQLDAALEGIAGIETFLGAFDLVD